MKTVTFTDFPAISDTVTDVDCVMTFCNPKHRTWVINQVPLPRAHVQLGRLGSGNIVEGQAWSDAYLLYLPLSDRCAYAANGQDIGRRCLLYRGKSMAFSDLFVKSG